MPSGAKHKLGRTGVLILATIAAFSLFTAMVVVPAIARSSGIDQSYVTYAIAAVAFVLAIVATRWAKSLNKQKTAE